MATPYSARAYQATAVGTSDRNHQVVLLFDAAVRFMHRAIAGMESKNYEAQCDGILRTQKILSILMAALDSNINPEFSKNLFSLYNWLYNSLTEASLQENLELLTELTEIVTNLRDAWQKAEQSVRLEEATEMPQETRAA